MSARTAQSRRPLAPEKDVMVNSEGEGPLYIEWGWMVIAMEEVASDADPRLIKTTQTNRRRPCFRSLGELRCTAGAIQSMISTFYLKRS